MASSSASPSNNAANVKETTTIGTVKRTAATLGGAVDPAPPVKRRRFTLASPLLPSSVKAAASSRLATSSPSPSASAGKTTTAPRARARARPLWGTSSSSSVKAPWLARSPTRFAGKSAPRLARAIHTPAATSSSSSVKAASSACRSAGKTATPPVRGSRRPSKIQEAKSRRLRDGRISSEIRKKELTEGRDAAATVAARVLQEASIFDSLLRNESEFSEICDSAKVSDPLPIVDAFLSVYEDTIQWKNITESVASVEISSAKYWVVGDPHVVHELSLPNTPIMTKSTAKERTAELAKNLCGQMQTWFLDFVEEALNVENKWKHSSDTSTLLSQFEKISDSLEQIQHQIMEEEEWAKEMIKRLKHRISHNLRRLKEWGPVPPRTQSRRSHQ